MYVHVKVTAGAKKESFGEKSKGHFIVSVREPAERNLANSRIIEIIAAHFAVPPKSVRIINGHHSPSKILSVDVI
jgi:uncharacterized protein YggU (UPF0235/DUF167 family)